ncbi:MAG: glycosyl transferase family 2 [Acidimicrobiaceae bacterium]|nr:glycosyl transferase family 2 [Acidimicrobiaceae bacterium]|tara:strand:+ start:28178 stop:29161 length:984 start_codon:yes stop_codon:yes gene_type:complete
MDHLKPPVSVIMPVRNAAKTLERTIETVLNQSYTNIVEIILAIGPSDDETSVAAEEQEKLDPRIQIVENKSGGTARGLNLAAEIATGEYLVRVDAHCLLPDSYVDIAVKKIRETGAGNVGGIQMATGEIGFQSAVAAAMTSKFGVGNSKFHYGGLEGPVDTVYLGVFDAALFRELGGFDEKLIRNQDYELNIRIREAGRSVWFTPEMVVKYFPRSNISQLFNQFFQYGSWKRKVIFKHPKSMRIRQVAAPSLIILILASIVLFVLSSVWYLIPLITYLSVSIAVSILQKGLPFRLRVALSLIFVTMHVAWGLGFLFGRARILTVSDK